MTLFDTGLRPVVDAWLLKKAQEVRDYGEYWSASSAGYCMRKVMFDRLGVPPVVEDARKQRVFSSGHIFHQWMQGITKEAGISIAQELELQDMELMVRGHFDDLILVEQPGKVIGAPGTQMVGSIAPHKQLILYDYKTRNSKNFHYAKLPSYFHKMQLGTYMYMLRKGAKDWDSTLILLEGGDTSEKRKVLKELLLNLTDARTLNISKDDLRMAEVKYPWSKELEQEVINYWTTLNKLWKSKKLPPCTCAEREGGFMATELYNPYFYNGEPCSLEYVNKWKKEQASEYVNDGS